MVNCNNSGEPNQGKRDKCYARLQFAHDHGLGWARCSGGPEQWFTGGQLQPARFDPVVKRANDLNVNVYLFLEWRPDLNSEKWDQIPWYEAGKTFGKFYGTRVGAYGVINEADHDQARQAGFLPEHAAYAAKEFSKGVKEIDPNLVTVSPSMGGTPMSQDWAVGFLKAVAPLINNGQIDILNLHSYHDCRSKCNGGPHWSCLYAGEWGSGSEWAPHKNFITHKKNGGITANVKLAAGEFNFREWQNDACPDWGTWERRGKGFLAAFWSQISVVGNNGIDDHKASFHSPFDIFRGYEQKNGVTILRPYAMAYSWTFANPEKPVWEPNPLGETFINTIKLTQGMKFIRVDPHEKGIVILRGNNKKMWVWQNRETFSDLHGVAAVKLTGIPADATKLMIYKWDSKPGLPHQTIALGANETSKNLGASGLPNEQTIMIVADSENDGGVVGNLFNGDIPEQKPEEPTNLTAKAVLSSQVLLTWTDNSEFEAGFKIERKSGSANFAEIDKVTGGKTSYTCDGLEAETEYSFRVRAYNSYGNSGYTNTASAKTPVVEPPLLHWKLDEKSGTIANDASGNKNHGTAHNIDNADWVSGKTGGAIDLDGGEYVTLDKLSSALDGDFSVAFWFKADGRQRTMIELAPALQNGMMVQLNKQYRATIISGNGVSGVTGSIQTNDGEYHHLAITRSTAHGVTYRIYIDGEIAGSTGGSKIPYSRAVAGAKFKGTSFDNTYDGILDDIRIYARMLSLKEIYALAGRDDAVVAYYPEAYNGMSNAALVDRRRSSLAYVYDMRGRLIYKQAVDAAGDKNVQLNKFGTGLYVIRYKDKATPSSSASNAQCIISAE